MHSYVLGIPSLFTTNVCFLAVVISMSCIGLPKPLKGKLPPHWEQAGSLARLERGLVLRHGPLVLGHQAVQDQEP